MKKHIIAVAVAATVSMPALAQVTVGGNFDLSYDFGNQNSNNLMNPQGALSTSALTMSGKEDLGGGMYAIFTIASRLGQAGEVEGAVGGAQTAANAEPDNRQGTINFGDRGFQVGIGGAFGEFMVGKTTGTAIGGTIRGGVAGNFSLLSESLWGDRPNSMISYTTPTFSGFKVRGIVQGADSNYEVSVNYTRGPLTIDAAYNSVAAAVHASADGVATLQGSGAKIEGNDRGFRVQYNFGIAALNTSYVKNQTAAGTPNQHSLGVTVPLGAAVLLAEIGDRDREGANNVGGRFNNIGAIYNLSKRTNAYFMYSKVEAATVVSRNSTGLAEDGRSVVGLRHTF